jgi:hypothetical protein
LDRRLVGKEIITRELLVTEEEEEEEEEEC